MITLVTLDHSCSNLTQLFPFVPCPGSKAGTPSFAPANVVQLLQFFFLIAFTAPSYYQGLSATNCIVTGKLGLI